MAGPEAELGLARVLLPQGPGGRQQRVEGWGAGCDWDCGSLSTTLSQPGILTPSVATSIPGFPIVRALL